MECFGPKSLMGFIRLILFVCIGWNLTTKVETEEMPVYTYLKLDGYTVMKADATHEYKPWTSIRCSAACYETPDCHGYYFLQGICKLYKGIRKISKQDSSHVMVQENKREILEYNRYALVEGRWIRYTEQKRTYRGGLEYCKQPLEEARHFVFKNADDSQFFIRKVDAIDDEVWLGLDDEANEADDEDSGYMWLDGSKILRSQWGTFSIDKIDDDNDEKDYGAAKINNNEVEIKFKKITDEYATFLKLKGSGVPVGRYQVVVKSARERLVGDPPLLTLSPRAAQSASELDGVLVAPVKSILDEMVCVGWVHGMSVVCVMKEREEVVSAFVKDRFERCK